MTQINDRIAANRAFREAYNKKVEEGQRAGRIKRLNNAISHIPSHRQTGRRVLDLDFTRWPKIPTAQRVENCIPDEIRDQILIQDALCLWCRLEPSTTIDHVIPLSRGGTNHPLNTIGCCLRCNISKSDFLPVEIGWRLTLPQRGFWAENSAQTH